MAALVPHERLASLFLPNVSKPRDAGTFDDTHAKLLSAYAREEHLASMDSTAAALTDDLEQLSLSLKFAPQPVQCRSRTCVASLHWQSREAAEAALQTIIGHRYSDTRCGVRMDLPRDSASEPSTTVVFQCDGGSD